MADDAWGCKAYGNASVAASRCFAAPDECGRVCRSLAECHQQVASAEKEIYRLMHEEAAAGDPLAERLVEKYARRPDQIFAPEDDESGYPGDE